MSKIIKTKHIAIFFLFCCFSFANAAKGPEYRSLRVHGMGGAFVAVADGKEALYYNPAGLNLKKRFENFDDYPDMGYMPRQRYEFRLLTMSVGLPANQIGDVIDICGAPTMGKIIKKILLFDFGYLGDADWCPVFTDVIPKNTSDLLDSVRVNGGLYDSLRPMNRNAIEIGAQISVLEFSMHNFGFAAWLNTSAAPYIDLGTYIPGFGYEPVQIDFVVQTAIAFSPINDWSFGVGVKAAKRYRERDYQFMPGLDVSDPSNPTVNTDELDSLQDRWDSVIDSLVSLDNIAFGLDFGILYQITRQIRLGGSLRNVFFGELAGESITPNLSFGAMASPMILQSNSWWARKVNFAVDYVDILNDNLSDMPLAHLNFGAELEQVVLPSPTRDMSTLSRTMFGFLGGVIGIVSGYFIGNNFGTAGAIAGASVGTLAGINIGYGGDLLRTSIGAGFEGGYSAWNVAFHTLGDAISLRFGSYAEERGVRTGQKEHRYWTGEFSVGF